MIIPSIRLALVVCDFSGMIMELKLVIKDNSEVVVGCNCVNWNSIKIIEAMMVSWAIMEMLTFGDVKFQLPDL